jgi:hypothetical protein
VAPFCLRPKEVGKTRSRLPALARAQAALEQYTLEEDYRMSAENVTFSLWSLLQGTIRYVRALPDASAIVISLNPPKEHKHSDTQQSRKQNHVDGN